MHKLEKWEYYTLAGMLIVIIGSLAYFNWTEPGKGLQVSVYPVAPGKITSGELIDINADFVTVKEHNEDLMIIPVSAIARIRSRKIDNP